MPGKKISELDPATLPLAGTEEAEIIQGGANVRVPVSELGGSGGGGGPAPVLPVTGTTYDVLAADVGSYLRFTDAGAKTVTVQDDATEALPDNGEWHIRNAGAGDLTLVEDAGVTINPPAGGTLVLEEGMTITLKRVAADEFDLIGQTVPL